MDNRRAIRNGWMTLTLLLLLASTAWAQQGKGIATIYAVGDSSIRGEDMSASRKEAIASGLVAVVTDALTDIVPHEVMVGNFQILNEIVLNQPEKFVRDYKVLTESTQGKRHRVMVQASVSNKRLINALKKAGIHVGAKPYPRVLLCLAEKEINGASYQYWWGNEPQYQVSETTQDLRKILKSKGFIMVVPRKSQAGQNYPPELSVAEAVALGGQYRAQVVVVGLAEVEEATNTMGDTVQSFRSSIKTRAYRVDTGEEVAQSQRSAMQASADPYAAAKDALHNAALLAGEDLAFQIADTWFSMESGVARTEVSVEGVGGQIANFVKFRGTLSTMSGVESVQLKEMMPDTALLTVEYQGSARGLVEDLLQQNFDHFGVNIIETTDQLIRLQLVSR